VPQVEQISKIFIKKNVHKILIKKNTSKIRSDAESSTLPPQVFLSSIRVLVGLIMTEPRVPLTGLGVGPENFY
jgi:hypothetical protein